MKKILKKILIGIIIIISLIGLLVGLILFSIDQNKKQSHKEMLERSKECDLNIYIKEQPEIDLLYFKNSELEKIKFEIIRNSKSIKDTIISGVKNKEYRTSIKIPFKTFSKSDTILLTINNELQYYISDFHHRVTELYGMTGPVAFTDCFLIDSYIINDNQNTREINKFYGKLKTETNSLVRRISNKNSNYEKLIQKYNISEKQTYSIGEKIENKYDREGSLYTIDFGIEINNYSNFYIKGVFNDGKLIEIVKINSENGEFTKGLKNYPIENKY